MTRATTVLAAMAAAIAASCILFAPGAFAAADTTVWLCKPGIANNPCTPGLDTTEISPTGQVLGVRHVQAETPKADCFYVYPTVSEDKTANSDLSIDPELRSIALYQAARYSQLCRVFAPVYRQITLTQLLKGRDTITPEMADISYRSLLDAWNEYLNRYNRGRGVILIGHSQGTAILRRLISEEIDNRPAVRKRIVSAILLGGNVHVKEGKTFGGDFRHLRGCKSAKDLRCVVAFSTFDAPVPSNALFGRAGTFLGSGNPARFDILCTNPAALRGGWAPLDTVYPSEPFAPGTIIGIATNLVGIPKPSSPVTTPWIEARGAYTGRCSSADDADVLQITPVDGAPDLAAIPDATWGLHLVDANIALGNLVSLVRQQIAAYVRGKGNNGATV
jgi:hypothetical protein